MFDDRKYADVRGGEFALWAQGSHDGAGWLAHTSMGAGGVGSKNIPWDGLGSRFVEYF